MVPATAVLVTFEHVAKKKDDRVGQCGGCGCMKGNEGVDG